MQKWVICVACMILLKAVYFCSKQFFHLLFVLKKVIILNELGRCRTYF
jgi:hypothetical protein